ncbi:MAG: cell division protein FtsQ/DivIB [Rhodobacteraceae bacterium]|nr:cell division protein FtsQ/DivIB [Paracoccaceae bacterium]
MQQVGETSRDPAPSRMSYRMQRWMLTPGVRLMLRAGIPMLVVFAVTSGFLASETRRDAVKQFVADIRLGIQERPEFMVSLMAIDGAGLNLAEEIREAIPLNFPISSFDLELKQIRDTVSGLDPVKNASVRIKPGGILQIDVIERLPVVVWRDRRGVTLLDEAGVRVEKIPGRSARADLPLIAGRGADKNVAQALALIAASGPLRDRVRGLVRIGERRWDLVLDRSQRILLPTTKPVRALEHVIALSQAQDMLKRDLAVVDMRLAARPTIRMSPEAVKDWWQIRETNGIGH